MLKHFAIDYPVELTVAVWQAFGFCIAVVIDKIVILRCATEIDIFQTLSGFVSSATEIIRQRHVQ